MSNSTAQLRFASDILQRLGEELIPNAEQGLIELVKNSYDAESRECTVILERVTELGGTITIIDKGNGMQRKDLEDGFLVIGRSRKDPKVPTPKLKRLPVGDKGLGRLAALRLGHKVTVKSRPKSEPGVELTLVIDWDKIESTGFVEKVSFTISESKTKAKPGVTIEIHNLRKVISESTVGKLARELLLLSDPFKSDAKFKVKLQTPEFEALQKLVEQSYFEDAAYYLKANTNDFGYGKAELINCATGVVMATTDLPVLIKGNKNKEVKAYQIPKTELQLWMFKLGGQYTPNSADSQGVKKWLNQFGGVYVYHRNLRVRPYGDPGSDWLDMNLSRVSHPEERPSTNNSIGRVTIKDPEQKLLQPTSRTGFVDNQVFEDLRRFGQDAIRWSSTFRLKLVEEQRKNNKSNAPEVKAEAVNELEKSLKDLYATVEENLPKQAVIRVNEALNKVKEAQNQEVFSLREDLQLYRSLATAGTTSVVFAHESSKPLTLIDSLTKSIEKKGIRLLGNKIYDSELLKPVNRIKSIFENLNVYSKFPIYHLKKSKRRVGIVNISEIWLDMVDLFLPILKQSEIDIKISFDGNAMVRGSIATVEAIAANLISNSVYALTKDGSRLEERLIEINGSCSIDRIYITHSDNGPGIKLPLDEIWLPGRTTNSQGTGFGLTIVRDSVGDMKGEIKAVANGRIKGAEFNLNFPLVKS